MCCSVLQCVAYCCSVLQCVVVETRRLKTLFHMLATMNSNQSFNLLCSVLQCFTVGFQEIEATVFDPASVFLSTY